MGLFKLSNFLKVRVFQPWQGQGWKKPNFQDKVFRFLVFWVAYLVFLKVFKGFLVSLGFNVRRPDTKLWLRNLGGISHTWYTLFPVTSFIATCSYKAINTTAIKLKDNNFLLWQLVSLKSRFLRFLPRCMQCRRGIVTRFLSVRLSVRPSHAWSLTKRKKGLSRFLYHTKEHLS